MEDTLLIPRLEENCVFYCHLKNPYHVGQFRAPDFILVRSILVGETS